MRPAVQDAADPQLRQRQLGHRVVIDRQLPDQGEQEGIDFFGLLPGTVFVHDCSVGGCGKAGFPSRQSP